MKKYGMDELLEEYGMDDIMQFISEFGHDSIVPGICTECGASYEYEPDQDKGFCEECGSNTVVSGLILMGVM